MCACANILIFFTKNDRIATHILSFEGDSKVVFYEGSYSEYEEWKKAQGGDTQPHRVRYKKLMA